MFLQRTWGFTRRPTVARTFNDKISEHGRVHQRLHVLDGVWTHLPMELIRKSASVNGQDFHEPGFADYVGWFDFDIKECVRKGLHKGTSYEILTNAVAVAAAQGSCRS